MTKKLNPKEVLIPTVALFLIALIATLSLAVVNMITKDKIAEQDLAAAEEARQTVMTDADHFDEKEADGFSYYEAIDKSGNLLGYVFTCVGDSKGYGGDVSVTVGVDTEGVVTGIVPGDLSNETPGLGQNAQKESFKKQFVGKSGQLAVTKDGGDIQALTSATITSRAVTSGVNKALTQFETVTGGAN